MGGRFKARMRRRLLSAFRWAFAVVSFPVVRVAAVSRTGRRGRTPRRIVAVSLGGRGDLVTALLALSRLGDPGAPTALTLIADSTCADVREWSTLVRDVIARKYAVAVRDIAGAAPRPLWRLYSRHPGFFIRHRMRRYDLGLVLGPSADAAVFGARLLQLIGPADTVGLMPPAFDRLVRRSVALRPEASLPDLVAETVRLATPGPQKEDPSVLFPSTPSAARAAGRLLGEGGIQEGGPFVVIHPGGRTYVNLRRWPPERFARVADLIQDRFDLPIVVTGGWDDMETIHRMVAAMKRPPLIAAARASFAVTGQIFKRSRACLTNDTAALHVARVVKGTGTFCIFGPSDPANVLPAKHRIVVFQSSRGCAPCETSRRASQAAPCPEEPAFGCLWDISVAEVFSLMEKTLEAALTAPRA